MNQKPKVLTQGAFDGACLLYALMNAYKTLVSKAFSSSDFAEDKKNVWEKIVKNLNSPVEILNGHGSPSCFKKNENEVKSTDAYVEKAVNLFARESKSNINVEKISIVELLNVDFTNSVVILCYTKKNSIKSDLNKTEIKDHWVCAVGFNQRSICVQCSFTSHLSASYKECKHNVSGRYYNQKISTKQFNSKSIAQDFLYLITLK